VGGGLFVGKVSVSCLVVLEVEVGKRGKRAGHRAGRKACFACMVMVVVGGSECLVMARERKDDALR
jgi:hypothetical protein